jgi:hypothetical protein
MAHPASRFNPASLPSLIRQSILFVRGLLAKMDGCPGQVGASRRYHEGPGIIIMKAGIMIIVGRYKALTDDQIANSPVAAFDALAKLALDVKHCTHLHCSLVTWESAGWGDGYAQ